ncbi:MAG: cupin domain-containing protein [Pseudanabaenaceae cyanobacterium]
MEPPSKATADTLPLNNLLCLPQPLPVDETFTPIIQTDQILSEKIISIGHTTPPDQWYDQERDEWVMVVQGNATLMVADNTEDGTVIDLVAGDYLLIPAHCRHRVIATSQEPVCIWLAIHGDLTGSLIRKNLTNHESSD